MLSLAQYNWLSLQTLKYSLFLIKTTLQVFQACKTSLPSAAMTITTILTTYQVLGNYLSS